MAVEKRNISECNDIIVSAKGSQISEVGKGKRVDVYLEVRKRRGHIFFSMKQVPVLISLYIFIDKKASKTAFNTYNYIYQIII